MFRKPLTAEAAVMAGLCHRDWRTAPSAVAGGAGQGTVGPMDRHLFTVLGCSSEHLTEVEEALLRGGDVVLSAPYPGGFFVWVDEGLLDGSHPELAQLANLAALCAYVRERFDDVDWIRFDEAGETLDGLPVFAR